MDNNERRNKTALGVQDTFGNKYDPTTSLDPEIARQINNMPVERRPAAVDQAFDEAGTFAKLRRLMMHGYSGDIYKGK